MIDQQVCRKTRARGQLFRAMLMAPIWIGPLVSAQPTNVPIESDAPRPEEAPVAGTGVVIPIHTEITDITADSVRRRLEEARQRGASTVIFELDTPGGLVTSTFDIADQIRNLADLRTVAWVNTNAHSGGALVAIACNEIVMARSSRIGDAQVIMGLPTGAQAVPDELKPKIMTPVLSDVRASAQLRGYSQALCESLVDPDREVWWVENVKTGEREFVFREEKIRRLGERAERGSTETTGGSEESGAAQEMPEGVESTDRPEEPEWKLVETYRDIVLGVDVEVLQPVVRDDQLLQMSPSEAYAYGFSKGIVANDQDIQQRYGLASLARLSPLWSESLALWMTSIWVRGFLMVIILLGAYVEFHTPGVGVPGLVALIALGIFVGAPYLAGLANVWEILFIAVGFLLIALEIFVIPGFGVPGILGIVLVLIGLLATFVPDEPGRSVPLYIPSLPSTVEGLKIALGTLVASMAASLAGMFVLSRYLPRMPLFGRIVPANPTPSEVAVSDPYSGLARVGDIGMTAGPLRPAGKARFGPQLVDVVTQGEYLGTGVEIEVIERRGNRVVVRARVS
jgi:membrane-bound serine protease (ClpP class)